MFEPSLAFAAPAAPAATPPNANMDPADSGSVAEFEGGHENIFKMYVGDLISPFRNPTTLNLLAGGTISTLTLLATHNNFEDNVLEQTAEERPLGRYSAIGDYSGQMIPNAAYVLFFGGKWLFTKDPLAEFRAEMMIRATLAATSFSTIAKAIVREPRPKVPSDLSSFPSGHSTSAFSFATIIAAMHGPYWGAAAYGLATFVAFSRMNDDRHRLHDVVAGATIGSMYGLAVYERMRDATIPSAKMARRQFQYEVVPVALDDGAMLGLSATF